jgi:hypothetical protein
MGIRHVKFTTARDLCNAVPDGCHDDDLHRARLAYAAASTAEVANPSVDASRRVAEALEHLRQIEKFRGIL